MAKITAKGLAWKELMQLLDKISSLTKQQLEEAKPQMTTKQVKAEVLILRNDVRRMEEALQVTRDHLNRDKLQEPTKEEYLRMKVELENAKKTKNK